jgi:hypothetical protein
VHRHAWEGEGARAAVLGRERLCALPCSGGRGAREGECEGESGGRRRPSGSRLGGRSTTLGCAIAGREREKCDWKTKVLLIYVAKLMGRSGSMPFFPEADHLEGPP